MSQEVGQVVWYFHLFKNFPVYGDPHSQRLSAVFFSEITLLANVLSYLFSETESYLFDGKF